MTKDQAIKEARIGALLHGGTYYVTCKGETFGAVSQYHYRPGSHGRVIETFDMAKVRLVTPPQRSQGGR